jgi:hypothetical protein
MKLNKWTLGLAALGLVSLAPGVWAQATPAPAPAPAAPATPAPIPVTTALSATTISGYVDTSMVWNPGTGNANPAPYSFNAGKQDGFNLDSAVLQISRAPDEGQWGAGYTLELQYGADTVTADAPIRQAYVELRAPVGNGLDFEIGQFDNIIGYESNDDYKNPNWTRSYGYSIEPTTHTGVLATYKFSDAISAQVGVVDDLNSPTGIAGNNIRNFDGAHGSAIESKKSIVSLLSLTAPDSWGAIKGSGLYVGLDYGSGNAVENVNGSGVGGHIVDKTHLYVGATINTPVKDLTFGVAWDTVNNMDVVGGGLEGYASALGVYGSYKITDKLTINGRGEYAHGSAFDAILAEPVVPLEQEAKVVALTGTLQYDLWANVWANVISRLEVRWDHSADGTPHFGGTGPVFGGGYVAPTKLNDFVVAANFIYKF